MTKKAAKPKKTNSDKRHGADDLPVVAPPTAPEGLERDARAAAGKALRQQVPRGAHAEWMSAAASCAT